MRVGSLLVLLALSLILLVPGAALAAGDNPLSPALDLGLWSLVVFLVLLFVLWKTAWKPICDGLNKREHDIAAAIEDARKAREEAELVRKRLQAELDAVNAQVRQKFEEADRQLEQFRQEEMARTKAELAAERDRLRREMDLAFDQALKDVFTQLADVAALISTKALGRVVTPDDHRALVDEAITEIERAAEERRRILAGMQS